MTTPMKLFQMRLVYDDIGIHSCPVSPLFMSMSGLEVWKAANKEKSVYRGTLGALRTVEYWNKYRKNEAKVEGWEEPDDEDAGALAEMGFSVYVVDEVEVLP